MPDLGGQTLGRYRIVEKVGARGTGVVYRAHDERLEREASDTAPPTPTSSKRRARHRSLGGAQR